MRVISQKLRDSARGRDCTLRFEGVCNYNPETTVLAHVPCGHKGMGMKGPDNIAVFACSACHDVLDGRNYQVVNWLRVIHAIADTQLYWIAQGLMTVKGMK